MPDSTFLEESSLYSPFELDATIAKNLANVNRPAIKMDCPQCDSDQTFNMQNAYGDVIIDGGNAKSVNQVVRAEYLCASCKTYKRFFLIKISSDGQAVTKVGQFPEPNISIKSNVLKILGDYKEHYRKGLTCEKQGYGIGAFAYYRRIIEGILEELLDSIADLIEGDEKDKYLEALKKTKKEHKATDKIELIKDLLPPILKPEGINPLDVIYGELSKGIHSLADEECLVTAVHIKKTLDLLQTQVSQTKGQAKEFTESMRKLLDKKAKRKSEETSTE